PARARGAAPPAGRRTQRSGPGRARRGESDELDRSRGLAPRYGPGMLRRAAILLALTIAHQAFAQPAPTGKHPRIVLDDALRAQWKKAARDDDSAVHKAIAQCEAARRDPHESDHDNYMALDWSGHL